MGWVWRDDDAENENLDIGRFENRNGEEGEHCTTRRTVKQHCRTEEVEPGRFLRKCEKTEQILKDCFGRPVEVLQSNKEYTEEDVTDQVTKGSFDAESSDNGAFDFPGLHSDIDAIERRIFGNLDRFFGAAEEMRDSFFNVFRAPGIFDQESRSSPSPNPGMPIQSSPRMEPSFESSKPEPGHIDLSGLAKDV